MRRCNQCRYTFGKFRALIWSYIVWPGYALTNRFFFEYEHGYNDRGQYYIRSVYGGWRASVGTWFVQQYQSGRYWPSRFERQWCACRQRGDQ
jgi:hypothetical protein